MHTPLQGKLETTCLSQRYSTLLLLWTSLSFKDNYFLLKVFAGEPWELGKAKACIEEEVMAMGRVGHSGVDKWPKAWKQLHVTVNTEGLCLCV